MMVDPWIHGTTDPVPADIGDYIGPITAVFAGGECGAAESVVAVSEIRTKATNRKGIYSAYMHLPPFSNKTSTSETDMGRP